MPAIWLTQISEFDPESLLAKHFWQWLSTDEKDRFRRYKLPAQRTRHLLSRALLRQVLSEHLNTSPKHLIFGYTSQGKPYLKESTTPLAFNLSHSGDWIALSIATCETLGIDIEHPQKKRSVIDIAESYFHSLEIKALRALTSIEKIHYFHTLWTLKEAFLKARGTGISEGLNKIAFEVSNEEIQINIDTSLQENKKQWQFYKWRNPIPAMENANSCYLALALKGSDKSTPTLHYTLPTVYCNAI